MKKVRRYLKLIARLSNAISDWIDELMPEFEQEQKEEEQRLKDDAQGYIRDAEYEEIPHRKDGRL